jgi:hypothetical protein
MRVLVEHPLFDDRLRTLEGGASHVISQFDYLNESARPEAVCVRDLVDEWLSHYPAPQRGRLVNRLRSRDNILHHGAFFELLLHELLLKSSCEVIAIERSIEGSERKPDFLASTPGGERFYLEATLATGRSQADAGRQQLLSEALQAIDSVESPNFFLSLHIRGMPTQPISARGLRHRLRQFLAPLDPAVASAQLEQGVFEPYSHVEEHDGVRLLITAVPKHRPAAGRALGGYSLPPRERDAHLRIRDAVAGKASRYGELDLPYIVAVNAQGHYADCDDAFAALFGSDAATEQDGKWVPTRMPDGALSGPRGPQNTRVSAVLSTERLGSWSIRQQRARLIHNPWAQRPLISRPFALEEWRPQGEHLVRSEGASLGEIFGLPEGWPEGTRGPPSM